MLYLLLNRLIRTLKMVPLAVFIMTPAYAATIPAPAADIPMAAAKVKEIAVLAGGCFWGMQSVFKHVKGVTFTATGYSGGTAQTADYETVSSGTTEHAESVEISYDPSQVSFGQLLQIYFSVAHDPTQLNRQGPDRGRQYRSAIFYANDAQRRVAQTYIAQLQDADAFPRQIVTQVVPLQAFYAAEVHHQDYAERHPNDPYIVINDLPKVANLRRQFPALYSR